MRILKWCYAHRRILIADLVCLILCLVLTVALHVKIGQAYSQQEGKRWAADEKPYHQVSAFWPALSGIAKDKISEIRAGLQRSLLDASFSDTDTNGKLWTDAYMAVTTDDVSRTTMQGLRGKEDVMIMGVGGDFFLFHSFQLISGSYFQESDVMQDRVLLDRDTAWAVFGGYEIEGQRIYIGGVPYVVAGVYEKPTGEFAEKAIGGKSILFMSYASFHKQYEGAPIVSYEAVLPNPVSGFALNKLQDAVDQENTNAVLVDNEDRFTAGKLLARFADIPSLLMQKSAVVFPFWENEMRALEWHVFCLFMLRLLLFMTPLVSFIFGIVTFIRRIGKDLWIDFWKNQKEKLRRRLYERPVKKRVGIEEEEF